MANNQHLELIVAEIDHARSVLREFGVEHAQLILHGSARRGELRTTDIDPQDPSDIDLLAIVSPEDWLGLDSLRQTGATIGRVQSPAGAVSLVIKLDSISKQLSPTEIDIYTQDGLAQESAGDPNWRRTAFVRSATSEGVVVVED